MNRLFKQFIAVTTATLLWIALLPFPSLAFQSLTSQDLSGQQAVSAQAKPSITETIALIENDLDQFWAGLFAAENIQYYSPNAFQAYQIGRAHV